MTVENKDSASRLLSPTEMSVSHDMLVITALSSNAYQPFIFPAFGRAHDARREFVMGSFPDGVFPTVPSAFVPPFETKRQVLGILYA